MPVITPDLPKLEYRMDQCVKVFDLTAEVVECEFLPGSHMGLARRVNAWGYNGSVPGPMIERPGGVTTIAAPPNGEFTILNGTY